MGLMDWILLVPVLVYSLYVIFGKKKKGCCGDCSKCSGCKQ